MKEESILKAKAVVHTTVDIILDAAIACVKQWGIDRVTLNDIASQAKMARSTVYKYYTNRDDVIRAALLQSAYGFVVKLTDYIQSFPTPEEKLIEAILYSVRTLPSEPSLALLSDTSMSKLVSESTLTSVQGIELGSTLLTVILGDDAPQGDELDEMSDMCIRFLLSLVTMKSPRESNEEQFRGFIARRLLPSLGLTVPQEYVLPKSSLSKNSLAKDSNNKNNNDKKQG